MSAPGPKVPSSILRRRSSAIRLLIDSDWLIFIRVPFLIRQAYPVFLTDKLVGAIVVLSVKIVRQDGEVGHVGVFVVPIDDVGAPVRVAEPPTSFRFSMINPVTGRPYSCSRWRELPDYAAAVIEAKTSLCPGEWDVLVEDGEVAEFVDIDHVYDVPARKQARMPGPKPVARPAMERGSMWRLSDINPTTGKPLMESPWRTLPGHVCETLSDVWGYTPSGWDHDLAVRLAGGAR